MKVIIEILRIILILFLLGGFSWIVLTAMYTKYGVIDDYQWIGAIGIYVFLFVLYRNKLQFSGWYKGEGRVKLSKKISYIIISLGCILISTPFIFT